MLEISQFLPNKKIAKIVYIYYIIFFKKIGSKWEIIKKINLILRETAKTI